MTEGKPPIGTTNRIGAYIIHSGIAAVLSSFALLALSWTFNSSNGSAKSPFAASGRTAKITNQAKTLSFADRVAYQRAIEEVYWQHRIWPKANADPKPALDAVMSQAQREKEVEGYLRNSHNLALQIPEKDSEERCRCF